ncbi:MAG TPA: RIP metalloprotease RseP [Candidatus Binatia bacterium]|jgi:regulator of sigma E protease|nr:RIP metalloprotease RseP [Candidatus Binatia bacterium]
MLTVAYAIVSALIGLGVLIIIHELGHFLVAKKLGVGVLTFSVGFGPKLLKRKIGETEYALSAFPLGGYVKMIGEDPEEEVSQADIERSFSHQGVGKRAAIVAAGPLFNLLLAVVLFGAIFMFYGVPLLTTRIAGVEPGSPAAKAGIQKGDRVVAVDGDAIREWEELSARIKQSQGKPLQLTVQRADQEITVTVQPTMREGKNIFGETIDTWVIGIASEVSMEKSNPLLAIGNGFYKTGEYSVLTLLGLVKMIRGDVSPKNLGGPLLIAQMAGQQAQEGLASFLFFVAILSVNLGVLNLLPIPVLDGGHLLFFLIESLLGRPVEVKHRERAQQIGIFVLILIMVYAFYNDISRLFEG